MAHGIARRVMALLALLIAVGSTPALAQAPAIGAATSVTLLGGASYEVVLHWKVENLGGVPLTGVGLAADLNATFGSGNFVILDDPEVVDRNGAASINLNATYDGVADTELLAPSTLDVASEVTLRARVSVLSGALGRPLQTQSEARGTAGGVTVVDRSAPGDEVDPNGNGSPSDAGEDAPTDFEASASVGSALSVDVTGDTVTFSIVLEAFGSSALDELSITQNLDQVFGGLRAVDLDVPVTATYQLVDAPRVVSGAASVLVNPGFDGSLDDQLLAPESSLRGGETATIEFTVRVLQLENRGAGLGQYSDQLNVWAVSENGVTVVDASVAGSSPDLNSNGSSLDDASVTGFSVAGGIVGVATDVTVNGSVVVFDIYLQAYGVAAIRDIQVPLGLDDIFGSGRYRVDGINFVNTPPVTLAVNPGFNGAADTALLAAGGSMNPGEQAQIRVSATVNEVVDVGLGRGLYEFSTQARSVFGAGVVTTDLSVDGMDPDGSASNDGDPTTTAGGTGDGAPTQFTVGTPAIGGALATHVSGLTVALDFVVENTGSVPLTNIAASLPLNPVFGSGNYSIVQQPTLVSGPGTLSLSPQYFGFNIFDRVIVGGTLLPGERAVLRVIVQLNNVTDQGNGFGIYLLQFAVTGFAAGGGDQVSDLSDYGLSTDPNGNGDAGDSGEDDVSRAIFGDDGPSVGAALTASVNGNNVVFDVVIENFGGASASALTARHALDAVLGVGNYSLDVPLTLTEDPGTVTLNSGFDAAGNVELLAPGGTLAAGATVGLQFSVTVVDTESLRLASDTLQSQVLVSAEGSLGAVSSDASDSGTDPDPNGNGNPRDEGEDDPTLFNFLPVAGVGLAQAVSVDGSRVTLDYYVENLSAEVLDAVTVSQDLNQVFGAGNYRVVSAPAPVSARRSLSVAQDFDGSARRTLTTGGRLLGGTTEQVRVVVDVLRLSDRGEGLGVYLSQASASARTLAGAIVTDLSAAGRLPDANGNAVANDPGEDTPTRIVVTAAAIEDGRDNARPIPAQGFWLLVITAFLLLTLGLWRIGSPVSRADKRHN